jgi:DNA-binding response OmpR family regulator
MISTITIIEDDPTLIEFLTELLKSFLEVKVESFSSGIKGVEHVKASKPNLVLVDLMLGDIHGKTVCEEIRKVHTDVPIIILTGDSTSESIVACLNAGADDYVTKPFNSEELIARVNAKIRGANGENPSTEITIRDIKIDTQTFEVFKNNKPIELTAKEFELLHYLMVNTFRVCLRDSILYSVWGYTSDVDTRVVDVHIGKLRKKLEDSKNKYIKSVRGHGYRFIDEDLVEYGRTNSKKVESSLKK